MHEVTCPICGYEQLFDPITSELTDKQRETLEFIENYISENDVSPTQREIAEHFGIHRKSVIRTDGQGRLDYLKRKGYVTWEKGKFRSIRILKGVSQ